MRILRKHVNPISKLEFTDYKLDSGDLVFSVPCEDCGEPIFTSDNPRRDLNYLIKEFPNHSACIINDDLFRKIARIPVYNKSASSKGMYCFDCMEKKLGRKINYDDLYFGQPNRFCIPLGNFAWIYKFYKEGKVSKDRIILDLKRAMKEDNQRVKDYKKEIEFYENITTKDVC